MRGSGRLRGVLAFGLSMLAAGVLRSSGAAGAAGPPALMLILGSYVQAGWHAASIRMWVRGGGCATRPVVVPGTITRPGRGGPAGDGALLGGDVVRQAHPSGVARLGSHGPPGQLTV